MARITAEIDVSKAALLRKKAEKFGILPDQFVTASIEDLSVGLNLNSKKPCEKSSIRTKSFINGWPNALPFSS